jgi:phosphoglycolate phosphatase
LVSIQCLDVLFSNIKAIIFDKDGTLAHSEPFLVCTAQRRLALLETQFPGIENFLSKAFGLAGNYLDPTGLIAVGSRRDCEVVAAAAIAARGLSWIQALTIAQEIVIEAERSLPRKAEHTPLFPGALDVLRSLKQVDVKVGIVSADTLSNVQDFVQYCQLQPYIQLQMGVESGLNKPDPRLLYQACEALGISLHEVLMVGDSEADMTMAHAAGVTGTIGVSWGWQQTVPPLVHANVMIDQFEQLQILTVTK